ncbi:MAG: T9SS type A sorting domain-containing protein [Flavobacteriales bacterium]|nr:T9SS type A sorting domain-containing protein [Flavobacteriales bacterium]
MNALVAVYNSELPARDTVVDLLNIHNYPTSTMRLFLVSADPNLPWMQQLSLGITPTGTPSIDTLLSTYGASFTGYQTWPWGASTVTFETQHNVNIPALCSLFEAQPGVGYAEPNGGCCDGDRITDSVYTDHVNLAYSHGWGDCPAGCTERRFWTFNVYPDCSVQYLGSYGSTLPGAMHVPRLQLPDVGIHPNPVDDVLRLRLPPGFVPASEWDVHDATGRVVRCGRLGSNISELSVAGMDRGTYLLVLHTADGPVARRFIKR